MTLKEKIRLFNAIRRNMGPGYILARARLAVLKKTGWLKRKFPVNPPGKKFTSLEKWSNQEIRFFFDGRESLSFEKRPVKAWQERAEEILNGKIRFFHHTVYDLGADYDWLTNPVTGYKYPADVHWTDINELDKNVGDIKFVWEKSRFSYLYDIVRYDHHFDEDHAAFVFGEISSWIDHNPVNMGPNYICGQETGLRVLNWIFFLHYYKNSPVLTEELFEKIMHSIYWQLKRIYSYIGFTMNLVRNNHAITEAAALYLGGLLFPFFPEAERWEQKGKQWFEREIAYQVYPDGSYLQFSMNYHRVVVQLLTWVIRLSELNEKALVKNVYRRAAASLDFISVICMKDSGYLPLYGANDGALFFPLNECRYRDFRPQLNALSYVLNKRCIYGAPGTCEDVQWLFNPVSGLKVKTFPEKTGITTFEKGGYFLFREPDALTFIRCGRHKDRPSQADNLHLDIWYKGKNLLHDSGSYLYNTEEKYISFFTGSEGHNTVKIGSYDQMQKGPRFIWLDWTQAVKTETWEDENSFYFKGVIHAFQSLGKDIYHERQVRKAKGRPHWEITDRLIRKPDLPICQIWHPEPDSSYDIRITAYDENGKALEPEWLEGWISEHYGEKKESPYVVFTTNGSIVKTVIKVG